jgi:hypothetical protein
LKKRLDVLAVGQLSRLGGGRQLAEIHILQIRFISGVGGTDSSHQEGERERFNFGHRKFYGTPAKTEADDFWFGMHCNRGQSRPQHLKETLSNQKPSQIHPFIWN